jgi:hypothetical protein
MDRFVQAGGETSGAGLEMFQLSHPRMAKSLMPEFGGNQRRQMMGLWAKGQLSKIKQIVCACQGSITVVETTGTEETNIRIIHVAAANVKTCEDVIRLSTDVLGGDESF